MAENEKPPAEPTEAAVQQQPDNSDKLSPAASQRQTLATLQATDRLVGRIDRYKFFYQVYIYKKKS